MSNSSNSLRCASEIIRQATSVEASLEFWQKIFVAMHAREVCGVGVVSGDFARNIMNKCPIIDKYIMLDARRRLPRRKKPENGDKSEFGAVFYKEMEKTKFYSSKRVALGDATISASSQIADASP